MVNIKDMELTVYGLPNCVQCNATTKKLKGAGRAYNYVDMSDKPEEVDFVRGLGYSSAPCVTVSKGGELIDHWSGFRPDKLLQYT